MSTRSRKGSFHEGECLDVYCFKKGPHYHKDNNTYETGPVTNTIENDRKAILDAYVGINEKRVKKMELKNAIKTYKIQNRKRAMKSLRNNNRRRSKTSNS